MDEDLTIINSNTRVEKIKNLFLDNKKKIIIFFTIIILALISFFGLNEFKKKQKIDISDFYNSTVINYNKDNKELTTKNLVNIIRKKDSTYSPLSLYFIIDNYLIQDIQEINNLFNILIDETDLDPEIKNLIIYKKALFNADKINENELLEILNPLIKSESIWVSHGLYLVAEYFFSKNERQKSKEFFDKILVIENANPDIVKEARKRLNRDFSD